jgi:hypothetical protein
MSSPLSPPSLTALAKDITRNAEIIESFLAASKLPNPPFSTDGPWSFPVDAKHPEILSARQAAMDAAKTLYDLLWGPEERALLQFTGVGTCPSSHLVTCLFFSLTLLSYSISTLLLCK